MLKLFLNLLYLPILILGEIGVGYYLRHFIKTYRNDKHNIANLVYYGIMLLLLALMTHTIIL